MSGNPKINIFFKLYDNNSHKFSSPKKCCLGKNERRGRHGRRWLSGQGPGVMDAAPLSCHQDHTTQDSRLEFNIPTLSGGGGAGFGCQ